MPVKKIFARYHDAEDCPITATIDVIGGKWKPPIIWLLLEGPMRFGELSKTMPNMVKTSDAEGRLAGRGTITRSPSQRASGSAP